MAQLRTIQGRFGFRNVQLVKSEKTSLGNGSYGAVYRVKCDQLVCAAKVLHPILFQTRDPAAYRIIERFQQEIEFLSRLKHPNIIQYLGSCADPDTRLPVLFMELMDESLTSFLERPENPPPLPLHVQIDIAHDVAQALSHLHRHEVLHRDLSSNNVLMIGSRRAKVTDFGMAKLLGSDPRLTPTYCPGTNGYMSPEALADPPTYTSKLDVFSCGVLLVQLITRKWPNPGPRTLSVQLNDPRFQSRQALLVVPELERRKEHLDLISPTHPLLEVALDCLKDNECQRPTAEQLCSRLIALKESIAYQDSLQQTSAEAIPSAIHQELQQQLRESESRVEHLTTEVQQLTLQNEEKTRTIQQKDRLVEQKSQQIQQMLEENQQLRQQTQADVQQLCLQTQLRDQKLQTCRENQEVVAALQYCIEQKDAALRANDELLQEKKRKIQTLQERVGEKDESDVEVEDVQEKVVEKEIIYVDTEPLKLEWRDGPPTPFATRGHSVAISGDIAYFCDNVTWRIVLMFNSKTERWIVLPECPKEFFSIAVVNGQLTAIGGKSFSGKPNTLLSLPQEFLAMSKPKWVEKFPPMKYPHSTPAVTTTNTHLIVAGGWKKDVTERMSEVEVMDTKTLKWSAVASLPHPVSNATATICRKTLYIGGGFGAGRGNPTNSVVMCKVKDLLQSQPQSLATRLGLCSSIPVWKEVAPLEVYLTSLVIFQDKLVAIGGSTTKSNAGSTSEVRQYNPNTNSWNVISQMRGKRNNSLVAVFTNNTLMVCGGRTPDGDLASVEIASSIV